MQHPLSKLVSIVFDGVESRDRASEFSKQYNFAVPVSSELFASTRTTEYALHFGHDRVFLSWWQNPKKPIYLAVDFTAGTNAHRRIYGGGKGQAVAKAVGVTAKFKPSILDATAGQGGDAFVLASLGCEVTMVERSPIAHQLLRGALDHGLNNSDLDQQAVRDVLSRMHLYFSDSIHSQCEVKPWVMHDVVYLDPMFPERKKSAAVKKEMRIFHDLVGSDADSHLLLDAVRDLARYRVVVKRSKTAPHLSGLKPTYQIMGKSTRFDIYVNSAMQVPASY